MPIAWVLAHCCATMKRWEIKKIMCRQLEIWELLSESKRAGIVWVGSRPISAAYLHTFTAFIVFIASNALLEIFPLSCPRTTSWHFNFARNGLTGYECTNRAATLDRLQNQKKQNTLMRKVGWSFEVWRLVVADFVDYGEQKQWSMVGRAALRKLRRFNLKTWGLELAPDHCELPMRCPQTMTHFD